MTGQAVGLRCRSETCSTRIWLSSGSNTGRRRDGRVERADVGDHLLQLVGVLLPLVGDPPHVTDHRRGVDQQPLVARLLHRGRSGRWPPASPEARRRPARAPARRRPATLRTSRNTSAASSIAPEHGRAEAAAARPDHAVDQVLGDRLAGPADAARVADQRLGAGLVQRVQPDDRWAGPSWLSRCSEPSGGMITEVSPASDGGKARARPGTGRRRRRSREPRDPGRSTAPRARRPPRRHAPPPTGEPAGGAASCTIGLVDHPVSAPAHRLPDCGTPTQPDDRGRRRGCGLVGEAGRPGWTW